MRYLFYMTLFIAPTVFAAKSYLFEVKTTINIGKLYADSIESAQFTPSNLNLVVKQDKTGFEKATSTLQIKTTIPRDVSSVPYTLVLNKNESFCSDLFGNPPVKQPDFTAVSVDNRKPLQVGEDEPFKNFNDDDGAYKTSKHDVTLEFKTFKEINGVNAPSECNGEIEFSVGVDI